MKLKILSWNIWCGTHLEDVIEFLKTADADIVALQEICEDGRGNIGEVIAKRLGYNYAHAAHMNLPVRFVPGYDQTDMRTMKFGPAILSKHKIVKSEAVELTVEDHRLIIKADIEAGDETLHVFSVHLKHTHQEPSKLQDMQAENLITIASGQKTIVMGDFNALPESAVIQKMNASLENTEKGDQTPTWCLYRMGCQICLIEEVKHKLDYIFTNKDIKTESFAVHHTKGSDHLPVSAVIEI
ncbi:MAG: endonuclease/exonuclease/phosphatase family protein [Patescibacteria group bacterium]